MHKSIKILNNIRILRAQTKECTLDTLEEMLEKLEVIVSEKRDKEKQIKNKDEEKTKKLQKYHKMLIKDGIDPKELFNFINIRYIK